MNDFCTYETAQRLKEAGFPQPVPQFKQIWFDELGRTTVIVAVGPDHEIDYVKKGGSAVSIRANRPDSWVFAPTATDILKELGGHFYLKYLNPELWVAVQIDLRPVNVNEFVHENPAECAAMAWLAINEKK